VSASVSIIIAYFNAADTIAQTLSSIEHEIQHNPNIDWQIIAVDDGSNDGSLKILNDWLSRLPLEIVELAHSGSPAGPRNHGIEIANKDFIFFLDADDVLLPGGLNSAIAFAVANDSDVVLPRLKSLDGRGVPRGMFSGNKSKVELTDSRIYWALNPMKLIRRSLLNDERIRFDSKLRRDEDQPFSLKVYLAANKISILADPPTVGVRYSPTGTNLTLRDYQPSDCFDFLKTMVSILDQGVPRLEDRNFLMIRHWEIEIARELFWKRLALLKPTQWNETISWMNEFSKARLVPEMLPKTSIRWRGIVGLIGTANKEQLNSLLRARRDVLQNESRLKKLSGIYRSNMIRLKSTLRLPKAF